MTDTEVSAPSIQASDSSMPPPGTPDKPSIIVVVPCYNEAARLKSSAFVEYLQRTPDTALIFVDDGSKDGTSAVLDTLCAAVPARASSIRQPVNQGKAEAVRTGVLAALDRGADYVGYWDADLATPLREIASFHAMFQDRADIEFVLGSRIALLGRDIDRSPVRHYLGRVFATCASLTLNLPVYDTQCGAKLLRVRPYTRSLFETRFGSRWIFDVELIARYMIATGTTKGLYEHVLSAWHDVAESKVKPLDFVRALGEMLRIYRAYPLNQPLRQPVLLFTSVFSIYALVGALGTGLHFLTLVIGVELFRLRPSVAATVGATVGALANYFMNYHMTFASKQKHRQTLPKFAIVAALAMIISGFGAKLATNLGIHYVIGQVLCTLLVLVLGFALNRFWTFRAP